MNSRQKALVVCATTLISTAAARTASATTPTCESLTNPIIIAGSTAVKSFIGLVSYGMSIQSTPQTLIYSGVASCSGVEELVNDDGVSACGSGQPGACATGNGTYYTGPLTNGVPTANTCTFDAAGDHVDVAISDAFLTSCPAANPALGSITGFNDYSSIVETMAFVVPSAATGVQAITAPEGYFVLGFPNADGIMSSETPWNNDMDIFVRSGTSGTQIILSGSIGVPAGQWQGVSESGSGNVASALEGLTGSAANQGLGILGIDYISGVTGNPFTLLAFEAFGQNFAYYPDSTSSAHDKQNVRDGHYLPWGYLHFITRSTPTTNETAVLNVVNGTTQIENFNVTDAAISSFYVPQCAMTVSRSEDNFSSLTPYTPPDPCDCYYVATATGAAPASCTACTTNASCPSTDPVCRLGYCEPR